MGLKGKVSYDKTKRFIETALGLSVATFLFDIIAFSTPYWYQAWPRIPTKFRRLGLWESCFAGFTHWADTSSKRYYGCWWIFSTTFKDIWFWLLPGWFITCQVLSILILVSLILSVCAHIVAFFQYDKLQADQQLTEKKLRVTRFAMFSMLLAGVMQSFVVIIFGVAASLDWQWMPEQMWTYLSWSYGLAVISAFFAFFTSTATYFHYQWLLLQEKGDYPDDIHMQQLQMYPTHPTSNVTSHPQSIQQSYAPSRQEYDYYKGSGELRG